MAESPNSGRKPDGEALRKEGRRWIERIKAAEKLEKPWIDDAEKAVAAYTGERANTGADSRYDFNILYANVETIVPAIINSPPQPDIRRRFADDDPVAKDGSELLERAIRIQVDDSRLQTEIEAEAHDGFLAGRGIIRLKFFADVEGGEPDNDDLHELAESTVEQEGGERDEDYAEDRDGSEAEAGAARAGVATVKNERIGFEAVSWRDFRHGPAKRWEDVPWVAFRHSMPMEDMEAFADKAISDAQTLPEDKLERGETDNDVILWEVWCKKTRKVKFVEEETGKIAKLIPDPLGLRKFFPIPTPMQPIELTGRLMPVNPFAVYRKLADELDTITRRIAIITEKMRVKGWYPGSATDLENMVNAADDDFVPIADAEVWAQNGGLQGAVAFWPAEKYAQVLRELYAGRNETKQAIYEITGISDIVRGASKATETLGAQQIKSQWGSLRIQKMQRMIERTARDLFVMMAEIISSKFSPETLEAMTGIQLLPKPQDLQPLPPPPQPPQGMEVDPHLQQQAQQAQQQWQQAEQARQQKLAHLKALNELLSDDVTQFYRVDVESDSTVRADLTQKKQEQAEFLQGTAAYFQGVAPMVQSGVISQEGALEIYAATARLFTLGKSTEDALEKEIAGARQKAGQPKPPSPEEVKAQADAEATKATSQAAVLKAQADARKAETDANEAQVSHVERLAEAKSKSEEEALQRQIKARQEADASAKRNADLANANALAELQRVQQAEKHQQEMAVGALNIQLLETKIHQANVQTDNSIRQADASIVSTEAKTNAGIAATEAKANQAKEAK